MDEVGGEEKVEANRKAIEFLQSIDFKTIGKSIFDDHLAILSKDGNNIGDMNISIEETIRDNEICYLVHSSKYSVLNDVPMGSSIKAYISHGLKTLDLTKHEYSVVGEKTIEGKTIILYDGSQYVVDKTISKGDNVTKIERVYPAGAMIGFISDGATILLQRIMCIKEDIPEAARFLSLDSTLNLVSMTYEKLLDEMFEVDGQMVQTVGIERETQSIFRPVVEQTRFLLDGHIAVQFIPETQCQAKLLTMPLKESEEIETTTKPEKEDLPWRGDMQLNSYFIERKEELMNDHQTYLLHKPELKAMLGDFLQFVLLRKPDDICKFAADYFSSLSKKRIPPQNSEEEKEINLH